MLSHIEMIARIAAGGVLGGVIGYERDLHRRPVGLRTHFLVALAAATFMVVSSQLVYFQRYAAGDLVEVDASRIAASVVSGIGFLAGGAILRTGLTVQGLTTAAGLWLVTAIGMCAGAGMLIEGAAVTALGILALTFLRRFEDKDDAVIKRRLAVVLGEEAPALSQVVAALAELGAAVSELEYERRLSDDKPRTRATFAVQIPVALGLPALLARLEAMPGVRRVHVQALN